MTITRAFGQADLSIRSEGDGRTIYGLAVPFDTLTQIRDGEGEYREKFRRGAFAQTINHGALGRVKLRWLHDRSSSTGVAVELREDAAGLVAAMRVSKTARGDEILELVRDGVLDQFSVGFRPVATSWSDVGVVHGTRDTPGKNVTATRTEVALLEISVVDFAAYDTALIGGVRATPEDTAAAGVEGSGHHEAGERPVITGASWADVQAARAFQKRLAQLRNGEQ